MLVESTLMDRYEPLYFNANFRENASESGWVAYRGELVLKEGEVADAQGRRKPPVHVLKQVALLTSADQVMLLSGSLDTLQEFPFLIEKFGDGLKTGSVAVLFTVNIPDPFVTTTNGARLVFIPLVQGMAWNELIDLVALEKSDFKGQSAADKVVTVYRALIDHRFKFPEKSVEEAMASTTSAKRENHGAI
ncbi:hypothetical protein [Cognatazoarcus halotolerans]|uniref:hypothetical protein n=1 Tax=Cognatazoarcus halotolerans TaxID=2686016 RepID=UPI001356D5F1|nr:hypothetical protein [Cognatazoarcus halotolerans]MCB1901856.1 hypothetical protein [Rhodocyclaceae bacterium]MCP5308392.1 hypothetical protein [Zoogloeaceae bacterium]